MLGTTFAHGVIRSYVVSFGTLFNNIQILRANSNLDTVQTLNVPLSYAPKERWVARLNQDPGITRDVGITLPRMSYELVSTIYDPDRKMNTMLRPSLPSTTSANTVSYAYSPVPYDFAFSLYIYARNNRDASAIVEQILPFFTPEFTVTIKNMTSLGVNLDVPIVLNNINKEDVYEGDFETRRAIVWTLDFTLKGVLYGPVRDQGLIKKAYIDFFIPGSYETITGNAQLGTAGTLNTIRLASTTSSVFDFYNGGAITITDGEASGDARIVVDYNGITKIATVNSNFSVLPAANSVYSLYYQNKFATSIAITSAQMQAATTASRIYTIPGLTANGSPTTNAALSVGVDNIDANDDYGYIQTVFLVDANTAKSNGEVILPGTRRNLKTGIDE